MKKCEICRKKIKSVLPTVCKCDKYFCGLHKGDHDCSFDYVKNHKERLKVNNPQIVPEKIKNKIY